jgi:capsular exopolysaccharide synthesis family protein
MELRKYFSLLRRWAWLIILGTLLAGVSAYVVSRLTTPVYSASAKLLVSESRTASGTADYNGILSSQLLAKTYSDMLRDHPVLDEVIAHLTLSVSSVDLTKQINVQPVANTQLILVSVENTDPQLAARIANELPKVFIEQNDARQSSTYAASRQNLTSQISALDTEIQTTQAALDVAKNSSAPGADAERARLDSNLTQLRSSYSNLVQSLEQVRLAEAQTVNHVFVVAPAEVPTLPVRPSTLLNTLLASVVGLMLGVGVAFGLDYLDDTLKTPDDIQQTLGLTTLGTVLRLPAAERNKLLLANEQPKSSFAEAFRTLRTNIQYTAVDTPIKTLLITSASPGEGKSTLASNLAVVMAQAGLRTLLVDADLRRPSVHRIFGLTNQEGLTKVLVQDGQGLDGNVRMPPVENLRVLTSGPTPPNPSELLGSHRMAALLASLKQDADLIVIDSPPALAVTDASVLAGKVDGVILVVESGQTRRDVALKAKEQLQQVGAHVLGAALNKLSERTSGYYYYNQYYASDDGAVDGNRTVQKRGRQHSKTRIGAGLARVFGNQRQH